MNVWKFNSQLPRPISTSSGLNSLLRACFQIGDRIIEVDGVDLRHSTHERAVEVIQAAGNPVSLLVQSLVNLVSSWSRSGISMFPLCPFSRAWVCQLALTLLQKFLERCSSYHSKRSFIFPSTFSTFSFENYAKYIIMTKCESGRILIFFFINFLLSCFFHFYKKRN